MRMLTRAAAAALAAAVIAAGLAAPVQAHDPAPGTSHIHEGVWVRQWTTDAGATWSDSEPDGFDAALVEHSSDSGSTWASTPQAEAVYNTGEADGGDGAAAGTYRARWSSDSGATWTATEAAYTAGESTGGADHDGGTPGMGDGPTAGQFRAQWSDDAGLSWEAAKSVYDAGEAKAAADNGNGANAGTYRAQWSNNSGTTWAVTEAAYTTGEAGTDSGNGPAAGQFRARWSSDSGTVWASTALAEAVYDAGEAAREDDGPDAGVYRRRSGQHAQRWACSINDETSTSATEPTRPCQNRVAAPQARNFDDPRLPPDGADWLVSGRWANGDYGVITRGELVDSGGIQETVTFARAKELLGFYR